MILLVLFSLCVCFSRKPSDDFKVLAVMFLIWFILS